MSDAWIHQVILAQLKMVINSQILGSESDKKEINFQMKKER